MKKSKLLSLVLTFAMLASMAVPAMAVEAEIMPVSAPVTEGHWSDAAMGRWAEVGVFKGDQYGDFMPDKEMTRAEFAQVLVNLMGYTAVAENTYADIPADAWYADAMLKLVAAGVMQGTGYNEVGAIVSPLAPISREQTAVLLCRALSLKPSADAKIDFPDASSVSDWAKDAVAALTERGMLNGTGDGNVSPALVIDRGSVAQMVSNMVSEYVTKDGAVVTGEQKGIVIVAAKDVTFSNAQLAETVVVAPKAAKASVTMTNGTTATEVVVAAEGANVTVGKNAKVESVVLDATKSAVTVNGTVTTVTVNATADNADVTANTGAKIGTVTTAAAGTTVDGARNTIGTIVAEATATNAKVHASGAKLENNSAETIGKVAPGTTGKAPSSVNGGNTVTGGYTPTHTGSYDIAKDVDATKGRVSVKVGGVEATSANDGETVVVTVTANKGYELDTITVTTAGGEKVAVTNGSFTMPAEAVTVTVTFKVLPGEGTYTITADVLVYTLDADTQRWDYVADEDGKVDVYANDEDVKLVGIVAGDPVMITVTRGYTIQSIAMITASGEVVKPLNPGSVFVYYGMPAENVKVTVKVKKH